MTFRSAFALSLTLFVLAQAAAEERTARAGEARKRRERVTGALTLAGAAIDRPIVITTTSVDASVVSMTLRARGAEVAVEYAKPAADADPASGVFRVTTGGVTSALERGGEDERMLVSILDEWVQANSTAERLARRSAAAALDETANRHQIIGWMVEVLDGRGS